MIDATDTKTILEQQPHPAPSNRESLSYTRFYRIKQKIKDAILRIPPRVRCIFVFFWFAWKLVLLLCFTVFLAAPSPSFQDSDYTGTRLAYDGIHLVKYDITKGNTTKVLYIVTSLLEFNDGRRKTIGGQDRFQQFLPVMINSVESMLSNHLYNLDVDIFLVCGYQLKPEREEIIRKRLPFGVGFQVWDDAIPLAYTGNTSGSITRYQRALARQHRFVIRDKFDYYDMFVAFEDDMLVHGNGVYQYLQLSQKIERLRINAPESLPRGKMNENNNYFAPLTKKQLERVIPGFMRVEVILNETDRGAQRNLDPIPVDHEFKNGKIRNVDPAICCRDQTEHNDGTGNNFQIPPVDDLIVWETNIKALSLRPLRQLASTSNISDWVVLMLGPGKLLNKSEKIEGYWSGRSGAFKNEEKPTSDEPRLLAQQGGWIATKEQLIRMNNKLCRGNLLPPFNNMGTVDYDDLGPHNVEFWSGSYQLFSGGEHHCNMQRIISMNPDHFSNHLLYHTSNNKQKQIARFRMVRVNNLFGQLNHVRKTAQHEQTLI